jgi:hypothetical protein
MKAPLATCTSTVLLPCLLTTIRPPSPPDPHPLQQNAKYDFTFLCGNTL